MWDEIGAVATVVGVVVAAIGLWYAGRQLRESRAIAKADFLLRLDSRFDQHNDVHLNLRGGKWTGDGGPETLPEWAAVEGYMGLFERVNVLRELGILDIGTIDKLYGYRVLNIDNNGKIHKVKLEPPLSKSWTDFIALRDAVKEYRRR